MNDDWFIDVEGFGLLRVKKSLIDNLINYRQLTDVAPESGGVILGSFLKSGGDFLVHDYTPPQDDDEQGRCRFFRSEKHNQLVEQKWLDSNYHTTYIGLWHTHPEQIPNYSLVDKNDWINSLRISQFEGDFLFFFIVGQTHIRCWSGTKRLFRYKFKLIGEYEFEG